MTNVEEASFDSDVIQLRTKNGLHFYLKPTNYEKDEVLLKAFARGGHASQPATNRASAELAPAIAWESGIGELSHKELVKALHDSSIDLSVRVDPFIRVMEGSCSKSALETLFQMLHLFFTQAHFDEKVLSEVLEQTRESISRRNLDPEAKFDHAFTAINTQGHDILQPLSLEDLEKFHFPTSKEFFNQAFTNPAEFTFVLVGDFDLEKVKELIHTHLEAVPEKNISFAPASIPLSTSFPTGTTKNTVSSPAKLEETITRIAFPFAITIGDSNLDDIETVCQTIETRLRRTLYNKVGSTHAIDVAYEFPLYPNLNPAWITLQYRCKPGQAKTLIRLIFAELESLQKEGPTHEEIHAVKVLRQRTDEFWESDNSYWISLITNYSLWGWDLEHILKNQQHLDQLTKDEVQKMIQSYFPLDNYTITVLE